MRNEWVPVSPTSSPYAAVQHLSTLISALGSSSPPSLTSITTFLNEAIFKPNPSAPSKRPTLDEPDCEGRLLLAVAVEARVGLAFEVFCLLLRAGASPFAVARDQLLVESMLDDVGGREGAWGAEVERAKEAWRARLNGQDSHYTIPPATQSKISHTLANDERERIRIESNVPRRTTAADLFAFKPAKAEPPRPYVSLWPDIRPPTPLQAVPPLAAPPVPGISTDPRRRPPPAAPPTLNLKFVSLPSWIDEPTLSYWLHHGPNAYANCRTIESVKAHRDVWPDGGTSFSPTRPPKPVEVRLKDENGVLEGWVKYATVQHATEAKQQFFSKKVAEVEGAKGVGIRFV
ncbi:hypothetical protein RQP46_004333 [Phenoliferia psychrophenolica]